MLTFYTHPLNFAVAQSTSAARIVSSRNIKSSTPAADITLDVNGESNSAIFCVTQNATQINTYISTTPNTDSEYFLETVGAYQYTLFHYTAVTTNPTVAITGGDVFRILVMRPIYAFDHNKFFSRIDPNRRNRTEVVKESLRGNLSKATHAESNKKRRIPYQSAFTEPTERHALFNVFDQNEHFTFSRNSKVYYDHVFPAFVEGDESYPISAWDWEKTDIGFTIQEE